MGDLNAEAASPGTLLVRRLPGYQAYLPTLEAMRRFTDARGSETLDELWLLEHTPIFTLGQAGREEHLLAPGAIPVVKVDRGGQVTYHGPGQLVAYLLLDLRRAGLGIKRLVSLLEQSIIDLLATLDLTAERRAGAPGVYVEGAKIAALGLRVRNGCSYHGFALNLDLDLEPFSRINPCGYPGLVVTRVADLAPRAASDEVEAGLIRSLSRALGVQPRTARPFNLDAAVARSEAHARRS